MNDKLTNYNVSNDHHTLGTFLIIAQMEACLTKSSVCVVKVYTLTGV